MGKTSSNLDSGFLILYDWLPALKSLPAEDATALLYALIDRQKNGTPLPEFANSTAGVFAQMIEPTIKRRLEGQLHGKKGTSEGTPKGTHGVSTAQQSRDKQSKEEHIPLTGGVGDERFTEFWNIYPKHTGREAAKDAFTALSLSDTDFGELMELVRRWKGSGEWKRENGRYIKQAAKFLEEIFKERVNPPDYNEEVNDFWNEAVEAGKRRRIS